MMFNESLAKEFNWLINLIRHFFKFNKLQEIIFILISVHPPDSQENEGVVMLGATIERLPRVASKDERTLRPAESFYIAFSVFYLEI